MVDDARLEQYRKLWTVYLDDYILIEHDDQSAVVCNRETQMPLMLEDDELRQMVIQKFIAAGIEKIKPSDNASS